MDEELIQHIRDRVAPCRRLADYTTDDRVRATLREMADEGEADLQRLQADRDYRSDPPSP
jgi:hypothetical protein